MNYNELEKTEINVLSETIAKRGYWVERFPILMDSMFDTLIYINKPDDDYSTFSYSLFQNSIYTFSATENLILRGYYLESTSLIRGLFEVFVKLRFFKEHSEQCLPYSQGRAKILYKDMFELYAPGLYNILYKQLLCEITHGGFGAGIFHN